MTKEASALRKQWRRLTIDYQIYSIENDRAYYPYRYVIDSAEENLQNQQKLEISEEDQNYVDTSVKWSIINNKQYFDHLKDLVGKRNAGNTMARATLQTLRHRDGTAGEDLYLIDFRSGLVADKKTDSKMNFGVEKTARMKKLLTADDDKQYILFHNHPMSSPPSVSDLNSLYRYKDKIRFGIIVGHDGTIYKYTAPSVLINQEDVDIATKNFLKLGYSAKTSYEKAMGTLSLKFKFKMEIIKNE